AARPCSGEGCLTPEALPSPGGRPRGGKRGSVGWSWEFLRPRERWKNVPGPSRRHGTRCIDAGGGPERDDPARAVGDQEVAVGDAGGPGPRVDEDVDPVVTLPEPPDLHPPQVARPAQGAQDVRADGGVRRPAPLVPRAGLPGLLLRWHHLFRN